MADSAASYIHGTAPSEQERLALLNHLTNPPFLSFLGHIEGLRVLEVGSGLGILAAEVSGRNSSGLTVGLDISDDQIYSAKAARGSNLRFCRGDAHTLPFRPDRFDLVYCRYLLEHVRDPLGVLLEMRRVLRRRGRALVQENNILINQFYPECPAFDRVWHAFVDLQASLGGDALIGKKLFALFEEAGFRHIELSIQPEVHWHGSPGFGPWIQNLIGNVRSAETALAARGFCSPHEIEFAIEELVSLEANERGSAYFYWNRVSGIR
jgi:ubiquinone/menaquinone biosynthesis C-methylase UbiE